MFIFQGRAREALERYVALFHGASIDELVEYDDDGPGVPGQIRRATATIAGQTVHITDGVASPDFDFTPAVTMAVHCASVTELERLWRGLLEGGTALIPLGAYGRSGRFGWVNDRFGVSWQLNLA